MATVIAAPGIGKLSSGELRALAKAARKIGVPVDWLATIIAFESAGSFDPAKLNAAGSGAFGLIQFLPSTAARLLKLDKAEAAEVGRAMSFGEQLDRMVVPYFNSFGRSWGRLEDMYLAVFTPAGIGQPLEKVLYTNPSQGYVLNKGLDKAGKGFITVGDVTAAISRVFRLASEDERVTISSPLWPWLAVPLGAVAALYLTDRYAPRAYRVPNVPALRPVRSALHSTERTTHQWLGKAKTWAHSSHSPVRALSRSVGWS